MIHFRLSILIIILLPIFMCLTQPVSNHTTPSRSSSPSANYWKLYKPGRGRLTNFDRKSWLLYTANEWQKSRPSRLNSKMEVLEPEINSVDGDLMPSIRTRRVKRSPTWGRPSRPRPRPRGLLPGYPHYPHGPHHRSLPLGPHRGPHGHPHPPHRRRHLPFGHLH